MGLAQEPPAVQQCRSVVAPAQPPAIEDREISYEVRFAEVSVGPLDKVMQGTVEPLALEGLEYSICSASNNVVRMALLVFGVR